MDEPTNPYDAPVADDPAPPSTPDLALLRLAAGLTAALAALAGNLETSRTYRAFHLVSSEELVASTAALALVHTAGGAALAGTLLAAALRPYLSSWRGPACAPASARDVALCAALLAIPAQLVALAVCAIACVRLGVPLSFNLVAWDFALPFPGAIARAVLAAAAWHLLTRPTVYPARVVARVVVAWLAAFVINAAVAFGTQAVWVLIAPS